MLKRINECDAYVALWCIYMLQDVLYPAGVINQSLQLVMLVWGVMALYKQIFYSSLSSSILKSTFVLILMYILYGGFHIMFIDSSEYYYLQSSLNSLVPIFLFFDFTKREKLTSKRIIIYLPILIVVCILLYYKNERLVLLSNNAEEITNNMGYKFVTLIPLLFFITKKPIIQYLLMAIILLYIFMGMKRGAIFIGVTSAIMLQYANLKESSRWTRIFIIILTIILVGGVSIYIGYMMDNSEYFMVRVEDTLEGSSSGRDRIYTNLWNTILSESRPLYFYLGRGANSTIAIAGSVAHQDWLETFCNNGLIGVLILAFFFYNLGKNVWQSRIFLPPMMFYSYATLFVVIFTKTLFSMSIQELELPLTMLLGYFAYWVTEEIEEYSI